MSCSASGRFEPVPITGEFVCILLLRVSCVACLWDGVVSVSTVFHVHRTQLRLFHSSVKTLIRPTNWVNAVCTVFLVCCVHGISGGGQVRKVRIGEITAVCPAMSGSSAVHRGVKLLVVCLIGTDSIWMQVPGERVQ